jgi:5-deoxy-D-glucuronate isomerase
MRFLHSSLKKKKKKQFDINHTQEDMHYEGFCVLALRQGRPCGHDSKYSTTFFAVCWDALHMMMMSVAAVVAGTL